MRTFILFLIVPIFAGCATGGGVSVTAVAPGTGAAYIDENGSQQVAQFEGKAAKIATNAAVFCWTNQGGNAVSDRFSEKCVNRRGQLLTHHAGTTSTALGHAMTPLIQAGAVLGATAMKADAARDVAETRGSARVEASENIGAGLARSGDRTNVTARGGHGGAGGNASSSSTSNSSAEGGDAAASASQSQSQQQTSASEAAAAASSAAN